MEKILVTLFYTTRRNPIYIAPYRFSTRSKRISDNFVDDKSTVRIVSCKTDLQLAYDCRGGHMKSRRILKCVLNPYDNRRLYDAGEFMRYFA